MAYCEPEGMSGIIPYITLANPERGGGGIYTKEEDDLEKNPFIMANRLVCLRPGVWG